ncbi:hypothetical protein LZ496_09935 [Sphingomonas sp. NSE70-1]|uniref:DUF551 domain-containing protein n=1 Tax=Sphingomonas caseinilyticus TaxID=2908205 RepID=A0ABT0RVS7_9SPHN|nr:hypothetical protein [Sphingomonas caseinilyticus]MCL6699097.1 hypothetical protein [Sphingomonas caseinilyticus]
MDWNSVKETYPAPNVRVLIATDENEVGVGYWDPDAGWMLEIEMGETDIEPLYWMELPLHPSLAAQGQSRH